MLLPPFPRLRPASASPAPSGAVDVPEAQRPFRLPAAGRPDVAVVVNRGPLKVGAAVFTSNRAKANPIIWSQQAVADRVRSRLQREGVL